MSARKASGGERASHPHPRAARKLLAASAAALALLAVGLTATPASALKVRTAEGPFGSAAQPAFHTPTALAVDQGTGELYVADIGNEVQAVTVSASEGRFRLCFEGECTSDIFYNTVATSVRTRLRNDIDAIGSSDVSVSGGPGDEAGSSPYRVTFQGDLEGTDVAQLECEDGSVPLGGGSGCAAQTLIEGAPHAVRRYNADGTASGFAALGSNAIDGRGGADATPEESVLANLGNGLERFETQIALDESGTATDGNLYVSDALNGVVDVFSAEGEYLGGLSGYLEGPEAEGAPAPLGTLALGIGVGEDGAVYVGDYTSKEIHKYVPTANPPTNADNTANFGEATTGIDRPAALALGRGPSAGALFATRFRGAVHKLDAESGEQAYVAAPGEIFSVEHAPVAVDPVSGHLLTAHEEEASEYDAAGEEGELETVWGEALGATVQGLAPEAAGGRLYVSLAGDANVEVWGPLAGGAPSASTEAPSQLGGTSARLNGTVKPEAALVRCEFQHVGQAGYDPEAADPYAAGGALDCAESLEEIGAGEEGVAVHADLAGLEPGSRYHYRLVAENEANPQTSRGEDVAFQTPGAVLGEAWLRGATTSEATLRAQIDPEGDPTGFHVQYGTSESYGQSTAELAIGSGVEPLTVGALLEGLAPGTTYHWRVIATNRCNDADPEEECVSVGPDHTLTTYPEAPAGPDPCANAALRAGPGARLPDCRAYELVSPLDKGGLDAQTGAATGNTEGSYYQSAPGGDALTYPADGAFAGALSAPQISQYLARRSETSPHEGGWASEALNAPRGPAFTPLAGATSSPFFFFSPDLCAALLTHNTDPPLEPRAVAGNKNLYLRENCGAGAGGFEAITREGAEEGYTPYPGGASADLTRFAYMADVPLGEEACATANRQTYLQLAEEAGPRLISVLPDGSCSELDSTVGSGTGGAARKRNLSGALSADGSRVYWTELSGPVETTETGKLYLRLNADRPETAARDGEGDCVPDPALACTIAVSELVSGEDARFWQATADGSAALFTIEGGLYRFEAASRTATPIASGVEGLAGASEDLSRVYLVSTSAEPGGEPVEPNSEGDAAAAGEPNLYLYEEGEGFRFVARVDGTSAISAHTDAPIYTTNPEFRRTRVSAGGERLAFASFAALTDYDNSDQASGAADREVYLYDATGAGGAGKLICVSCNPTGARPRGAPYSQFRGGEERYPLAGQIPGWQNDFYPRRAMTAGGDRLYFEAIDPLLPTDTNGALDVYQWQAPGTGDCTAASHDYFARNGGCLALISTGTGAADARFVEASADGSDVFFRTALSLYGPDPGLVDVYDAREGGGFHPPPPPPASCEGEACQSPPAPPGYRTPSSGAFDGPGNLAANRPGCNRAAGKARNLSQRAKRLRRSAGRLAGNGKAGKARRLRRKAGRLAARAGRLSASAKRCRARARQPQRANANRRAGE